MPKLVLRLTFPLVLLAVALLAGACDANVASYAAQVGTSTISQSTLTATLSSVASNTGYACELANSGTLTLAGTSTKVTGSGTGTYDARFVASVLDQLVQLTAVRAEMARRHLVAPGFARQEAVVQLEAALTPQASASGTASSCRSSGAIVLAAFPASYRDQLVELQADLDVLASVQSHVDLTSRAGVRAYAQQHGGLLRTYCVSLIPYRSAKAARTAAAQLAGGASFSLLAGKAGESNGGALRPCVSNSAFVAPLNTVIPSLPVGKVSPPVTVATASGTFSVLLLVTSATPQPLVDDGAAVLPSLAQAEAAIGSGVANRQHVVVAPAYGSWARTAGAWQVQPPSGPPAQLIPNPSAVGASGTGATGFGLSATGPTGAG